MSVKYWFIDLAQEREWSKPTISDNFLSTKAWQCMLFRDTGNLHLS